MILRNVSPVGDLYVTGYGLVEAGARFVVKSADVPGLIGQVDNFEPDDDEATAARAAYLAPVDPEPPAAVAGDPPADDAPPNQDEAH